MSRLLFAVLLLTGCAPTSLEDTPCPPGGTELTYESFGASYFAAYCTRCHGGAEGYARGLTSLSRIREESDRIFVVAAGPNVSMPPGPDDPPLEDRERLAEWLSCGAP